jgi:hypothetical protein
MIDRYTEAAKYAALKRELYWRKRVYPGRVSTGRMSFKEADYQIAIMAALVEQHRVLAEAEIAAGQFDFGEDKYERGEKTAG